jgi:hypothetical protein
MVEIDEGIAWPEAIAQFLASDNFAWILKQHNQNLEGLFWKLEPETLLAELASFQIHLENTKTHYPRNCRRASHEFKVGVYRWAEPEVKVRESELYRFCFQ